MDKGNNAKQLPKGWKWVKLGEVCVFIGGGTPSKKEKSYWNGNIFWASVKDIKGDYLNSTEDTITEAGLKNSAANIAEPNDVILITRISPGKTIIVNVRTAINQDLKIVKPKFKTTSKFISYYFKSIERKLINKSSGTTVLGITLNNLNEITIPLLDIETQNTIVSKIEELFSELDKGIENLRTAQQQLKTYRQSVLKWAFEGKLTNENVKDGELPGRWKWKQIKEITSLVGDGLHGTPKYTANGDYYFINGNNLSDGKIIFKDSTKRVDIEEYQKHKKNLNDSTILVSINGTLGNTAFYNGEKVILGKSACYFNLNIEADKHYIRYILTSHRFLNYATNTATGSTIPNVSLKAMREFEIPLPPIEEQLNIVQAIESRLSVADKMEESITQSLQQAEALRQSILKKAFEGKLVYEEVAKIAKPIAKVIPIERKVLAGKIIHLLHSSSQFGLTKFQKALYLIENFAEVAYETEYLKETAGPYDRNFTLAFRKEMVEKDWFTEEVKMRTKFEPGENVGSLIIDYAKYFRAKGPRIVFVIQQLKDKTTHDAELIATLYAVWNNRLIRKKSININQLIEDFFNWSPKKREEFQEEEVMTTYQWMKKIKLVPSGFGKVIEIENV